MQKTGLIDSQKPCNYQLERSRNWLYSYSVGNSDRETDPVSNDVENSNIEGHLFIQCTALVEILPIDVVLLSMNI